MDYCRFNLAKLLQVASQADWVSLVLSSRDVNGQWKALHERLRSILRSSIPQRTVIITNTDKDWMTPLTKALINDRWQAY